MTQDNQIRSRLRKLEQRLKTENPVLADAVDGFRKLDHVSRRIGFFNRGESHATRTSWWPLVAVLGIYSSGKSTFINHYLQQQLQHTGNQAIDDKFTVICFSDDRSIRVLPGLALDADPRFPFYKISQAIEEVASGEGQRIDAYLQLKTCRSDRLKGRIFIDSPGFDADDQRTSTLRITDHIIDLADLVLVFFDARHPETGSMRDTLEHLVSRTKDRRDSNKFLYILNQIDMTANDDNTEEVFASWQRALAQYGLTAGSCFAIYIPEVAVPIEDAGVRARFENKRDQYLSQIYRRIEQVGIERAYRILGMLEQTALQIENDIVPSIQQFLNRWRRRTLWMEAAILGTVLFVCFGVTIWSGAWEGFSLRLDWLDNLPGGRSIKLALLFLLVLSAGYVHFALRRWNADRVARHLMKSIQNGDLQDNYRRAFRKNSRWYRSLLFRHPAGWGRRSRGRLQQVLDEANTRIQKLNDLYANPSGESPASGPLPGDAVPSAADSGATPNMAPAEGGRSRPVN
jgi:hypothetical protein